MFTELQAKIPFNLLEPCSSKHEHIPDTSEYYKYNHYPNCSCRGSGQQPTSVGYGLIHFLKWLFTYHAWRLSPSRNNNSIIESLKGISKENEAIEERSEELKETYSNWVLRYYK